MWLDEVPRGMRRALFVLYGSDAKVSVYTYIYFFAHDPFIYVYITEPPLLSQATAVKMKSFCY
jgi:hypothetical protein